VSELSPRLRQGLRLAGVAAAYYVGAKLGLEIAVVRENVTPLWPPSGIAVAAFLVLGRRVWPAIGLAAFAVNAPISSNLWAAAFTAIGNTAAPLVAVEFLRATGFRRQLDRFRDAAAIVFLGALLAMTISAGIGATTLAASGAIEASAIWPAWAVWWTGDAMGVLTVAPFLFSLPGFRSVRSRARRLELLGLYVVVALVALLVLSTEVPLLFTTIPLLGWAAWRFQQVGAAPSALIVASLAAWSAAGDFGPFSQGTLFERMLTLQMFNAIVALASFVFAAGVSERLRQRDALARAAGELENRVEVRTGELLQRERQLAEAQELATIGSWEWSIPENRVTWSDEMFRIYGHPPRSFEATFERALQQVLEEDRERIHANVADGLAQRRTHSLPDIEYRIVRPDGEQRVVRGWARLTVDHLGEPQRMVGSVQDLTEGRQAEREHRIAETLQRSLLPEGLPNLPGVELAARYVPATKEVEVGGDWYDVILLPNGHVAVSVGDVAGHGLRAAATMGQLRMAVRAYALDEGSPASVLRRAHGLMQQLALAEMATLVHLVFDPDSGRARFASAGHPPPLVVSGEGGAAYLTGGLAPPLGAVPSRDDFQEAETELAPGSTLLLYTDGLIERRGASLGDGLRRLLEVAGSGPKDLDALCDALLASLVGDELQDDVALLALRPVLLGPSLHLRIPAEPSGLASLRHVMRRWLRLAGATEPETHDIVLACGEACANAIQHAYGAREGVLEVDLEHADGGIEVTVRDFGTWRPGRRSEGGHGLNLMQGIMEDVEITHQGDGSIVRMRHRLRRER
jgi:serine phosphatase RsbU (regulator of sigma subunit)/integral membrane sensor domain MASE1/anti-sigma regulatory factor (Ser/Thr protein kinase)